MIKKIPEKVDLRSQREANGNIKITVKECAWIKILASRG